MTLKLTIGYFLGAVPGKVAVLATLEAATYTR